MLYALSVVCASVLFVSTAPASVRVGAPTIPVPEAVSCFGVSTCAIVYYALPAPAIPASPIDGIIVRWTVRGAGDFRLFRASGDPASGFVRVSETARRSAIALDRETSFPARTPIRAGQYIGLVMYNTARIALRVTPGSVTYGWAPRPPIGQLAKPQGRSGDQRFAFNADIVYDRDGDGHGDFDGNLGDDHCPTDPATIGACGLPPIPPQPPELPSPGPPDQSPPAPQPNTPPLGGGGTAPPLVQPLAFSSRPRVVRGQRLRFALSGAASVTVRITRRARYGYRLVRQFRRAVSAGDTTILLRTATGRRLPRGHYRVTVRAGSIAARWVAFRVQ
jgi:hypothetical protein